MSVISGLGVSPLLVGENGLGLESLLKNIKKLVNTNRQISINVIEIKTPSNAE